MDRGTWWATVYGVAKNWTRLKRLSVRAHTHTHMHICYIEQTLHALNLQHVLCQLHLNKNKFKKVFSVTKIN